MTFESAAIGVRQVRLARILSIFGFVGLYAALGVALLVLDRVHNPAVLFSTYLFWLAPWFTSFLVWFLEPKAAGRIVVEPQTIRVERGGSSRVIARTQIESACSIVRKEGPRVEITLTNGDVVSLATPSVADADTVVAELGFGPGGRRQRFDLAARKRRFLHLALGFVAYQVTAFAAMPLMMIALFAGVLAAFPITMAGIALALPLVYRFFRKRATAPSLEIGDDGVTIVAGRSRRSRYLAKKDVFGGEVVAGGGNIAMNTAEGPVLVGGLALDPEVSRSALHAIERRWAQTAASPGARVAAFERSGRPVEAWRAELASKIASAGYRGDGISIEEADAVVRNAGASPDARIGAALALAAAGERVRIADAAAPIADPRLRVALEAVAQGREEREEVELIEAATTPRAMRL